MIILSKIRELKGKIEVLKNDDTSKTDKSTLCKVLVMLNLSEIVILSNTKIDENDKHYFEGQGFVGRYFGDWGLDWISDGYLDVADFIKNNNWM